MTVFKHVTKQIPIQALPDTVLFAVLSGSDQWEEVPAEKKPAVKGGRDDNSGKGRGTTRKTSKR